MNPRYWAIPCAALAVAGCANPQVSTLRDTKAAPSYSAPRPTPKAEAPRRDPDAYRATDSGRTYSLTLKNADIKDVLMLLSKESGVPIVAERNLRGTVKIEAQNRKLGELLYAILKPLGYSASVENGIIMVGRPQLATRTFRVNYIKDKRNSTSNMNVSGFSSGSTSGSTGSSGGSSGSGGTSGSSSSVTVSTEGKSDFWGAVESSLEMLVFGTSGKGKRDSGGYIHGEEEKKPEARGAAATAASQPGGKTTGAAPVEQDDPLISSTGVSEGRLKQLVVNEIAGIIQVTDYPENLDRIAAFLADVEEGSKRQVLIQAHIMEVSLKDSFSLGIDWKYILDKTSNLTFTQSLAPSSAAGGNIFRISAAGERFGVLLDAMKEQGNVNMLSSPKITALNNQKAVIKLTTKQVSWVSTKTTNTGISTTDTFTTTPQVDEVGIFLDVTPQIGPDGTITMQIHPSVSEIKEISTSPDKTSTKPIIDVREIDTMVDARAGETIVIAGLISDKLAETRRSVPLLGDIPYLGDLFSYNRQDRAKAELVIMMTPYVLNQKSIEEIRADHENRIRNMGGTFHLINNLGSLVSEESSRSRMERAPQPARESAAPAVTPAVAPPAPPAPAAAQQPPQSRVTQPPPRPAAEAVPAAVQPERAQQPAAADTPPALSAAETKPVPAPSRETAAPKAAPPAAAEAAAAPSQAEVKQAATPTAEDQPPTRQKVPGPTLQAVRKSADGIRIDIAGMKEQPVVIRESRNRRLIVQLPGVASGFGDANIPLDALGFERARVARHTDGTWVVLHASGAEFPRITHQIDETGLTLAPAPVTVPPPAPAARTDAPPAGIPDTAPPSAPQPELAQPPAEKTPLPVPVRAETAAAPAPRQIAMTSAGPDEQSLYRAATGAYKVGNCAEAVQLFSRFIATYPNSYFSQDAVIYRSDCQERMPR